MAVRANGVFDLDIQRGLTTAGTGGTGKPHVGFSPYPPCSPWLFCQNIQARIALSDSGFAPCACVGMGEL